MELEWGVTRITTVGIRFKVAFCDLYIVFVGDCVKGVLAAAEELDFLSVRDENMQARK